MDERVQREFDAGGLFKTLKLGENVIEVLRNSYSFLTHFSQSSTVSEASRVQLRYFGFCYPHRTTNSHREPAVV